MFGYKVETRLKREKTAKTDDTNTPLFNINKDEVKDISKTVVKHVTVGVVAIMTAATVLHTASEIVINNTNPANKHN